MSEQTPSGGGRPSLRDAVRAATALLAEAGVPSADHDARTLAAHVLGLERVELALAPVLPDSFADAYAELVQRRRLREPLQHIVGWAPFRHLTLTVRPGVFVPRPETESVAQVAVDEVRSRPTTAERPLVVDLCCGAGGIAIAVATETDARVVAVDVAPEAVALTRQNATSCGADMQVVEADVADPGMLAELAAVVDVVVANPPYIPPGAVPIDPEVRDHDPDIALYGGGPDGLAVPGAVVAAAVRLLRPGGLLVMEHADVQGPAARELVAVTGAFHDVRTLPDLAGRDRMVVARRTDASRPSRPA